MDSPASMSAAKWRTASKGFPALLSGDEEAFNRRPVSYFSLDKIDAWWQQIAAAVAEVVKNDGLMSLFGKQSCDSATDVPRPSGNQYLHKNGCPSGTV